jgi:hypothetical protein
MKVLPFFLKTKHHHLHMVALHLFLSHAGKTLWDIDENQCTEETLRKEYLLPNGLLPKRILQVKEVFFVEIDEEATKLSDFYSWEEAVQHPMRPECWRTYYFFKDNVGADWFTPKHLQGEGELEGISIQTYYEDILRHFT